MKPYWIKTRWFIKRLFNGFVWDIPNSSKTIYLTFDDGPTPMVTEWVLEVLQQHNIKATFFCIGNNIEKHPDIFQRVVSSGHSIGNHTFNHLNGWKTGNDSYYKNVSACAEAVKKATQRQDAITLFRPPYGKIKTVQAAWVRSRGYRIIMWDVLSADFDKAITPEQCLHNVIANAREGSVIIFHDSVKAFPNLRYALPRAIEFLKEKGFSFEKII